MGFKVTVEDAKCIQANAFIQEGIFQDFAIKEDQITFKINLTVLLVSMEANMEHNDYHILIYTAMITPNTLIRYYTIFNKIRHDLF